MNPWIQAARLRTLPLAISGILLGSALAFLQNQLQPSVLVLGLITAILLQVLSNFANDYGDFVKGTDTAARRNDRSMASGKITVSAMKTGLIITSVLTLISGILLLKTGIRKMDTSFLIMLTLGFLAIAAAIMYTVGKKAYGYYGFGDVFVLVFFGFVSVCGIYFLHTGTIDGNAILAGFGCGCLSVAVLNVNNIRDRFSDGNNGKKTIVVRFGIKMATRYHAMLLIAGVVSTIGTFIGHVRAGANQITILEYMMIIASFTPLIWLFNIHFHHIREAEKIAAESETVKLKYNAELKRLSLLTLSLVAFFWFISFLYHG